MTIASEQKKIGIISDAHGIRGEVYVIVFSGDVSWIEDLESLTLKKSNSASSHVYSIKKMKPFKKGFIATLENISTRNQAEELKKMEVWVDDEIFISDDGEQPFLAELLDFSVEEASSGKIGKVISFSSNGEQDLLVLDAVVNDQNIEIPFIKEFVIAVDYNQKKIIMQLPEGLIHINEKD
ncbi:MAG: 16S rRNA processing protein RimM [Bdellovibrionales bacterium RIFCSPHIGHO2_01_FULL_40_29]|nr:MAG: 16S rRNA processing protein RimM [Bdellovibrionales bacterium RIFCSPHIGHO2_01_FULL_40_29]OFZ32994.1 MAG: 16S rRNA processing protein RimM [Bdellovibrionales bacterium RIFCSPHIGHO2_02_FULL_40_15]